MKLKDVAILTFVLFLLVLIAIQAQKASANEVDVKAQQSFDDISTTESINMGLSDEPFIIPTSFASNNSNLNQNINMEIANDLITKTNKIHEKYWSRGWLHIKTHEQAFIPNESLLPNGEKVPVEATKDEWWLLNDEGYVEKAVQIYDAGSDFTHQIAIYENGSWTNLTLNFVIQVGMFKPELDFGLGKKVSKYQEKISVNKSQKLIDNVMYTVYSITDNFDQLTSFGKEKDGSDVIAMGLKQELYFPQNSNIPNIAQTVRILPDGKEQIEYQVEIIVIEQVQNIPDDIAQYLK